MYMYITFVCVYARTYITLHYITLRYVTLHYIKIYIYIYIYIASHIYIYYVSYLHMGPRKDLSFPGCAVLCHETWKIWAKRKKKWD